MDRVVPPISFAFDCGVDLGGNNQQASGEVGHCALLANYAGLNFQKRSNASSAGVYHEAETRCQSAGRSVYAVIESNRIRAQPWSVRAMAHQGGNRGPRLEC